MKYCEINQTHQDYDPQAIERRDLLYTGGDAIYSKASMFIRQDIGEHPVAYEGRLARADYVNYYSTVIDTFADGVFSKPLTVVPAHSEEAKEQTKANPFYDEFAKDVTLSGKDLVQFLKERLGSGISHKRVYAGCDFPRPDEVPQSLAEEEATGADRAYLFEIPIASVRNWKQDDRGRFQWVVLKKVCPVQDSPFEAVKKQRTQFKVWQKTETGAVVYSCWEAESRINEEPGPQKEMTLIEEGSTSFREIPVLLLELQDSLWAGNKVAAPCASLFRMRSDLFYAEGRSLRVVPFYQVGDQFPSNGGVPGEGVSETRGVTARQDMINKGMLVGGQNDKMSFPEPTGACYELVNTQMKELVDETFRTVGLSAQSVSATSNGQARSAASKVEDNKSLEIRLAQYGAAVRHFAKEIYTLISEARGEATTWEAIGLSGYEVDNRDSIVKEAMQMSLINIPSITFKRAYLNRIARQLLPNIAPETELQIQEEITEFCEANEDALIQAMTHPEDDSEDDDAEDEKPKGKPASKPGKPPGKKKPFGGKA